MDDRPEELDELIASLELQASGWSDTTLDDAYSWAEYARLRWMRFLERRAAGEEPDPRDLDAAVEAFTIAVPVLGDDPEVADDEFALALFLLADVLETRYETGLRGIEDVEQAIELTADALGLVPEGTPAWCDNMASLAERQFERYRHSGHDDDFADTRQTLAALLLVGGQEPDERTFTWAQVSLLHRERFERLADDGDRDEAIVALQNAWAEGSRDPDMAASLADLLNERGSDDDRRSALAVLDVAFADPELTGEARAMCDRIAMLAHYNLYDLDPTGRTPGDFGELRQAVNHVEALLANVDADDEARIQARVIRGLVEAERGRMTDDLDVDYAAMIEDFEAVRDHVDDDMRVAVDALLSMALLERASESQSAADIDRALTFSGDLLAEVPEAIRTEAVLTHGYALILAVQSGHLPGRAPLDRAEELFEWAARQSTRVPEVAAAANGGLGLAKAYRAYFCDGDDAAMDLAVDHLNNAFAVSLPGAVNRAVILIGLISALCHRYEGRGDLSDLQRSMYLIRDARTDPRIAGARRLTLEATYGQILARWAEATGDQAALAEAFDVLSACLSALPAGAGPRRHVLRMLAMVHLIRSTQSEDRADYAAAAEYAQAALTQSQAGGLDSVMVRTTAAATLQLAGIALDRSDLVRVAAAHLDELIDEWPAHPHHGRHVAGYGQCLLHLAKNGGSAADLERATEMLATAYELLAAEPGTPTFPITAMALGEAYALQGDLRRAVEVGRAALRGIGWQVLLQTGTHHAMAAVREGATHALTVARWCLRAGLPYAAREVLESGRGLVLHAATVTSSISDLLVAAGAADLAQEWEQRLRDTPFGVVPAADDWRAGVPLLPPDLRHRALTALDNHPLLFDPPTVPATTSALRSLRADALIYLFAGSGDDEGLALIVGADGGIDALDLPELTGDWAGVAAMRQMTVVRDLSPPEPPAGGRWSDLEEVSAAAWSAVVGRLLDHWRSAHGGEPHFVLAPAGSLAMIPWHAACGPVAVDGTRRWAIDEAAFSYIASGRLLVEVAGRRVVPVGKAALVIGDPDTGFAGDDLPGAGEEAIAIHDRFYPEGTFHGRPARRAAGPGVPEAVFAWLGGRDEPHATVLHLACHGIVRADGPASSSLRLAGGAVVSAEEILHAAANRPPGTSLGVVSLAACTTHLAGRDYDEAVTLSTAFLVAGAGTAFGSLWRVPDRETKLLMVDLHENLAVRGLAPRDALRAAQRRLRDEADASLASWAGFVHLGV